MEPMTSRRRQSSKPTGSSNGFGFGSRSAPRCWVRNTRLLATLVLRLRGVEVTILATRCRIPEFHTYRRNRRAYVSTKELSLTHASSNADPSI